MTHPNYYYSKAYIPLVRSLIIVLGEGTHYQPIGYFIIKLIRAIDKMTNLFLTTTLFPMQ